MEIKFKKFFNLNDSLNYLAHLMHDYFGYIFKPAVSVKHSYKIGGVVHHPARHRFLDDPKAIRKYRAIEKESNKKEEVCLKNTQKESLNLIKTLHGLFEEEGVRLVEEDKYKVEIKMTCEIMRNIHRIVSQFPDDFLLELKSNKCGNGHCTLYYVKSFGDIPVSKEIIFRFLQRHCEENEEEIFKDANFLFQNKSNQKLINLFKNVAVSQYQKK